MKPCEFLSHEDVATAGEQPVQRFGHERAVGDRDVRELRAHRRCNAHLVGQRRAFGPAPAQHPSTPFNLRAWRTPICGADSIM